MQTRAMAATKMAAALVDFFPVKYTNGILIDGIRNTDSKIGNDMFMLLLIVFQRLRLSTQL
jgi:hypothetical protein